MTHDELTPELRIEIQDNMIMRHNAKTRRALWEATKGKRTPVPVKKYNMAGDLVADGARTFAPRRTTFAEDRA